MARFEVGKVIRFLYPAANYRGAKKRLEPRILRIDRVLPGPAPADAVASDPYLERAGELVCGRDLERHADRSFYSGCMTDVEEVRATEVPAVIAGEPGDYQVWIAEALEEFGTLATLSPAFYAADRREAKVWAKSFNDAEMDAPIDAWAVVRRRM